MYIKMASTTISDSLPQPLPPTPQNTLITSQMTKCRPGKSQKKNSRSSLPEVVAINSTIPTPTSFDDPLSSLTAVSPQNGIGESTPTPIAVQGDNGTPNPAPQVTRSCASSPSHNPRVIGTERLDCGSSAYITHSYARGFGRGAKEDDVHGMMHRKQGGIQLITALPESSLVGSSSSVEMAIKEGTGDKGLRIRRPFVTPTPEQKRLLESLDEVKMTPLHLGCENGHLAVVTYLCDRGADINALDGRGDCPLHSAIRGRHVDIVMELLNRGADVSMSNFKGETCVNVAESCGDAHVLATVKRFEAMDLAFGRKPA